MSTDDVTTTPTPQPAADEVLAPDAQLKALGCFETTSSISEG